MTRQKKEIVKKINYLIEMIDIDRQLGCGCLPAWAYQETEEQIADLMEELAILSHYENWAQMENDDRWLRSPI